LFTCSKKNKCHRCDEYQKVQTLTRRCVGDAAAGLGLHFLHMSESPFSHDAGHMYIQFTEWSFKITVALEYVSLQVTKCGNMFFLVLKWISFFSFYIYRLKIKIALLSLDTFVKLLFRNICWVFSRRFSNSCFVRR